MAVPARALSGPFEQHFKEWFSRAFVQAASASAGVSPEWTTNDLFGVDVVLRRGGFSVDVQLKATAVPEYDDNGDLVFDLDVGTHNSLTAPERLAPAYLVVVAVGPERSGWIDHNPAVTGLLHEARWVRLTGLQPSENAATVRLRLPAINVLSASAIVNFLDEAQGDWR